MPKIRHYKAYKLKPGKKKIQGRTYKIQPIKKPRNLPAGSAILIPLKENNPVAKKRRKKKRSTPPRDKRGRFRKRKKRR